MFQKKKESKQMRHILNVTINKRVLARLKEQANREELPVSRTVEAAIVEYLENHKKPRVF